MKTTYLLVFSFLLIFTVSIYSQKPNVILIITDDQSFNSIGYTGGDVYTPRIDSLANEGIKFTNAHVPSTVCSPSRYSFLTSKYPGRCYAENFMNKFPEGTPTRVENTVELSKDEDHLGSILQANGYKTGFVGKTHIMEHDMLKTANWEDYGLQTYSQTDDPYDPEVNAKMKHNHTVMQEIVKSYGFDFADGIYMANVRELYNDALNVHNLEWQVDKALNFIDEEKENPFFLFFSTTLHHGPVPWGKKDGLYWSGLDADPKITGEGVVDTTWDFMPSRTEIKNKVIEKGFAENSAYAFLLDEGINAIYQKVANLGLEENTLIIFMPDHGSWRHGKATLHDFGLKVPMFMYWKDNVPSGVSYDGLVSSLDFTPTILDLAEIEYEGSGAFDGISIKHILESGEGAAHESLFGELGYARSVKTNKWKYIAVRYPEDVQEQIDRGDTWNGFDGGTLELPYLTVNGHLGHYASENNPHYFERDQLYDLEADPAETVNLYDQYPEVVQELKDLLSDYLRSIENRPYGEFTRDTNSTPNRASFPIPKSSKEIPLNDLILEWISEAGAESHDVYFGTENPPPFIGNQIETMYNPGTLLPETTYYWKVGEKNQNGTTVGDLWNFSTESNIVNLAPTASVFVTSESEDSNYVGENVIDGIHGQDGVGEWVSNLQTPMVQLRWSEPIETDRILLYDLAGSSNITAGTLSFSDGSSIEVGELPDDGFPLEVTFELKSIKWARFQITAGNSDNQGLAEFEVYKYIRVTSVGTNATKVPSNYGLEQNYPNPFNPSTTIKYQLPSSSQVKLQVFDGLGRLVKTLVDEHKNAGEYSVKFGDPSLTSGVYFYRLTASDYSAVRKLLVIR